MRLLSVETSASGLPSSIRIAPKQSLKRENWVTVITGENGTRKSLLLRLIAGAALGKEKFSARGHKTARASAKIFPDRPAKIRVFALSGTPNDRFPVVAGIPLDRAATSFDLDNYFYFGPSYAGGLATASRAVSTLAHSLLSESVHALDRRRAVAAILAHMQFAPFIGVRLAPLRSSKGDDAEESESTAAQTLRTRADIIDTRLASKELTRHSLLRNYVAGLLVDGPNYDSAASIASTTHRLHFDFSDSPPAGLRYLEDMDGAQHYANLVAMGALRVEEIWFNKQVVGSEASPTSGGSRISSADLSSGQWQLLTGLLNLTLRIRDESLVLVDEPENSLHPQWQRDYVELLSDAMGQCSGCHALIATHSPLIAAGVERGNGNLISVHRADDNSVEFEEGKSVYAWRPDDVLKEQFEMDSVRPPELIRTADRLLSIVGATEEGATEPAEKALLVERLQQMSSGLPAEDPLAPAIAALLDLAQESPLPGQVTGGEDDALESS